MKSSATNVDITASARNNRKIRIPPQSIPGILGGIAKTLGKVFAGYLTVSIVLGFSHFQYHVDDLAPPRKIEKAFYADI